MGETLEMIHLDAQFLSSCDPMKPENKLSAAKHNGGTGIGWTFSPIPKRRIEKEERTQWVLSKL